MASPDGDLFELLFPEGGEQREWARRWTQLLNLVVDDARARSKRPESGELATAQLVLAYTDLRLALGGLDDLLLILFDSLLDRDSFFVTRRPTLAWNQAWAQFARYAPVLATPPAPHESGVELAQRFVEAFGDLTSRTTGVRAARWERRFEAWRLALQRVTCTPSELDEALGDIGPRRIPTRIALAEARVQRALERGDVRGASAVLEAAGALQAVDSELAEWGRLLESLGALDEGDAAHSTARCERVQWSGLLPSALVGLVEGGTPNPRRVFGAGREEEAELSSRRSIGAVFVGLFIVDSNGDARLVEHQVAAGVADRVSALAALRAREWRSADAPEHRALVTSEPVVERGKFNFAAGSGAQQSAGASVCVPLPPGRQSGWVQIEFEHALIPSVERLRALVTALIARVDHDQPALSDEHVGLRARQAFADATDLAWFDWHQGRAIPIGLEAAQRVLPAVLLERVARLGLGSHAGDAIEPVTHAGGTIGVVAAVACSDATRESVRAIAKDPRAVAGWQDARFCDWAWEQQPLELDPIVALGGIARERVVRVARARADVELVGAPGLGKSVVVQRLRFEAQRPGSAVLRRPICLETEEQFDAFLAGEHASVNPRFKAEELGVGDWLVVRNPGRWTRRAQLRLATLPPGARLVALTESPLAERVARGGVEPALGARFAKLTLRLAPLTARREELSALVKLLARRIARVEGWRPPTWTDDALACLWRQSWPGNVRELDAVLYATLIEADDAALTLERVDRALLQLSSIPVERIDTSDERSFEQALSATRLANGRVNKRRAATYLGWDRETVAGHCRRREQQSG